VLRAGRPALPAKITSSISEPRIEVGRVSPITQRSASNRFDLPQPFGPITAVRPGSMWSSVGSTKDLKPESLSRVNFNEYAPSCRLYVLPHYFFDSIGVMKSCNSV
jgi:hypothetical protein